MVVVYMYLRVATPWYLESMRPCRHVNALKLKLLRFLVVYD